MPGFGSVTIAFAAPAISPHPLTFASCQLEEYRKFERYFELLALEPNRVAVLHPRGAPDAKGLSTLHGYVLERRDGKVFRTHRAMFPSTGISPRGSCDDGDIYEVDKALVFQTPTP